MRSLPLFEKAASVQAGDVLWNLIYGSSWMKIKGLRLAAAVTRTPARKVTGRRVRSSCLHRSHCRFFLLLFFLSLVVLDGFCTCVSKKHILKRSCPCCCLLLQLTVPDFVAHYTIMCDKVYCVCGCVIFIKSACTQMIISGNEAALLLLTVFNKHFTKFFNPPVFNFSLLLFYHVSLLSSFIDT